MRKDDDPMITESSGNVFADLGLCNADDLLVKADLAIAIKKEIEARGWTQTEAAERAHVRQPQISNIMRMRLDGFKRDRLQEILRDFGYDVEITLHRRENGGIGTLRVMQSA